MVARDLGTKQVTSPTIWKENPEYDPNGTNPKYVPSEPHIGSTNSADPKPKIVQTGYSKGGTTNPPEGESGEVEIVVTDHIDGDTPKGHDQEDLVEVDDSDAIVTNEDDRPLNEDDDASVWGGDES